MHELLISRLPDDKSLEKVVVPHAYIRCHTHDTVNKVKYRTALLHTQGTYRCPECVREAGRRDANKRYNR